MGANGAQATIQALLAQAGVTINGDNAWPELKAKYSERFYRMFRFYLLSCAGAFRARNIQLWQIVMTKPGRDCPDCRIS